MANAIIQDIDELIHHVRFILNDQNNEEVRQEHRQKLDRLINNERLRCIYSKKLVRRTQQQFYSSPDQPTQRADVEIVVLDNSPPRNCDDVNEQNESELFDDPEHTHLTERFSQLSADGNPRRPAGEHGKRDLLLFFENDFRELATN